MAPDPVNYTVDNLRTSISLWSFAVNTNYFAIPLYKKMVDELRDNGATIVEWTPEGADLNGFRELLHYDMKKDLPKYLSNYCPRSVQVRSVGDVISFNKENLDSRAPYGQQLFEETHAFTMPADSMKMAVDRMMSSSRALFDQMLTEKNVDAVLSINNYDAAYAAIAKYPALAIPMGYDEEGEPKALTLIGLPFSEQELLNIAKTIQDGFPKRIAPSTMVD